MFYKLRKKVVLTVLCAFCTVSGGVHAQSQEQSGLLERARRGEAQAQLEAGFLYFKNGNPELAAYWFNAAAMQNVPEAQYNLARCYMDGFGVEKNLHRAMELLQKASASNLLTAQLKLAEMLFSGVAAVPDARPPRPAIPPDEKAAIELLEKLSALGIAEAKVIYAEHLIKRYSDAQKLRILDLLKQASDAGNIKAQILLADYLLTQTDETRNEVQARKLLESAAQHSSEAMVKLAFAMENGFGAPPDPAGAFKLYEASLKQKFSPLAALRLANYYYSGRANIVAQNIPRAVELYTQAAQAGLPEAMYRLAECLYNNIGLEQDREHAFELYFQAAQMDYALAQYAVGRCFELGEGTIQDQQAAFYWYHQGAMRYEPRSLLETGRRYLTGNGVEKNSAMAVIFLEQALANGMNEAALLLPKAKKNAAVENNVPQPQDIPEFRFKLR